MHGLQMAVECSDGVCVVVVHSAVVELADDVGCEGTRSE